MRQRTSQSIIRQEILGRSLLFVLLALLGCLVFFSPVLPARAAKSSAGKLLFFPCDKCHPLGAQRPNGFEGHKIKLEGHDKLGQGDAACFVCHKSIENPDLLILADGSLINIDGEVSKVCYRCHFDKYKAWEEGLHGKQPGCTAKDCHNPHSPAWIAISPIPPFLGNTREVKAAGSGREPFLALPAPPKAPGLRSFPVVIILALVVVFGVAGTIGGSIYIANSGIKIRGRRKS